jgi:hypothetical protein
MVLLRADFRLAVLNCYTPDISDLRRKRYRNGIALHTDTHTHTTAMICCSKRPFLQPGDPQNNAQIVFTFRAHTETERCISNPCVR